MDKVVGVLCILEQTCQYHLDIEEPLGTSGGPPHHQKQYRQEKSLRQKYFHCHGNHNSVDRSLSKNCTSNSQIEFDSNL